ncbi:MAG: SEC-C domain-containing protein [Verrucomicrobiae bacterium]|nr:SEC-C domain-containing protein [Verrucomicrobiae bacterium]
MTKLGRNDPCHCGSGKKYKKCHLQADQRQRPKDSHGPADSPAPAPLPNLRALPGMLRKLATTGPAKDRKRFAEILAESGPLIEYTVRQDEIQAAGQELEAHRAAFEELVQDRERQLALLQSLFSEARFAPLRFTATEVRQALKHVGHPAPLSNNEDAGETLRAAILHLADKERRQDLATHLLLQLPDLVQAGRYLEGWLVQTTAFNTVEAVDDTNPFLFEMFSFGYEAWIAEKQSQDDALLRRLGVDVDHLRSLSPDEQEAWMESQLADPAREKMWKNFLRENPQLREHADDELETMTRRSAELVDREECRFLLLSPEEVEPWIPGFSDRLAAAAPPGQPDAQIPEAEIRRVFEDGLVPLLREMAAAIFTRERIEELVATLRTFRAERAAAGDALTAQLAGAAFRYIRNEDRPELNLFLIRLCWRSLVAAVQTGPAEDPSPAE